MNVTVIKRQTILECLLTKKKIQRTCYKLLSNGNVVKQERIKDLKNKYKGNFL